MNNNEITIIYNKNYIKDDLLKIFGSELVKNNRNKFKIIYENKVFTFIFCFIFSLHFLNLS